jgi:hypothetical protein
METTFRISCSSAAPVGPINTCEVFQKLSEMICHECGGGCKGFMLTDEVEKYQAYPGPKIGWVLDGRTVLLRMANCKDVDRIDRISQFLQLFGMSVTDSQLVQ